MTGNFHTHTRYSDGKGEPSAFAAHAAASGMQHLGFSEHAPVSFSNPWSLDWEDTDNYINEIELLKQAWLGKINIYRALEIDFIPGISCRFDYFTQRFKLDYTIGGVHLVKHPGNEKLWFIDGADKNDYTMGLEEVFGNNVKLGVSQYYLQQIEMIELEQPDIVAHFDKIKMHNRGEYFEGNEPWIRDLQKRLIAAFSRHGTIVEINTRGIYKGRCSELYPSETLIRQCYEAGVPLILNSDAHKPEELDGYFSESIKLLKSIGVKELMVFDINKFRTLSINDFGSISG